MTEISRHEIYARADVAFYNPSQTFLSEFEGDVKLYPTEGSA